MIPPADGLREPRHVIHPLRGRLSMLSRRCDHVEVANSWIPIITCPATRSETSVTGLRSRVYPGEQRVQSCAAVWTASQGLPKGGV
jgi:hypothetical protein